MTLTPPVQSVPRTTQPCCRSFGVQWQSYDRMLGAFGRRAIEAAQVALGQCVVDVGCGAGGSTIDAARAVGETGSVVGIDINPEAIGVARDRAQGLAQTRFVVADAGTFTLSPPADVLISRFGAHQFADLKAAYANLAHLVRPGGRVGLTCWRELERNAWAWVGMKAVASVLPKPPPSDRGRGPFCLSDPLRIISLLESAGFECPAVESVDGPVWVGDDVEQTVAFFEQSEGGAIIAQLSAEQRVALRDALRSELEPFLNERGVYLPASAWLVTARKRA